MSLPEDKTTEETTHAGISRIAHVAIAVEKLDTQIPFYRDVLGLTLIAKETVEDQGVRVAIFRAGDCHIELLEPASEASSLARFLARRGPGLHHIAFEVADVSASLEQLRSADVQLIDETPRVGAGGHQIAFVHPKASGGVLLELCGQDTSALLRK